MYHCYVFMPVHNRNIIIFVAKYELCLVTRQIVPYALSGYPSENLPCGMPDTSCTYPLMCVLVCYINSNYFFFQVYDVRESIHRDWRRSTIHMLHSDIVLYHRMHMSCTRKRTSIVCIAPMLETNWEATIVVINSFSLNTGESFVTATKL